MYSDLRYGHVLEQFKIVKKFSLLKISVNAREMAHRFIFNEKVTNLDCIGDRIHISHQIFESALLWIDFKLCYE